VVMHSTNKNLFFIIDIRDPIDRLAISWCCDTSQKREDAFSIGKFLVTWQNAYPQLVDCFGTLLDFDLPYPRYLEIGDDKINIYNCRISQRKPIPRKMPTPKKKTKIETNKLENRTKIFNDKYIENHQTYPSEYETNDYEHLDRDDLGLWDMIDWD